jgi:hypothetical protein
MNRFICRAFAFALLVASPSFAADMPGGRYQEPVEAPVYNWAGPMSVSTADMAGARPTGAAASHPVPRIPEEAW